MKAQLQVTAQQVSNLIGSLKTAKLLDADQQAKLIRKAIKVHGLLASDYYEHGQSAASDAEFDKLEALVKRFKPDWQPPVGAPVQNKKEERELEVPCASLDKIQAENPPALAKYLVRTKAARRFYVEAKIDGGSLLAHYVKGSLVRLTTRGDGIMGKTIDAYIEAASKASDSLRGLATRLSSPVTITLRYEAVMLTPIWERRFQDQFDSPRVIGSAAFNRKTPDSSLLRNMDFVLIQGWEYSAGKPRAMSSDALDVLAARNKMPRPQSKVLLPREMTVENLTLVLKKFREANHYHLDGLVLRPDDFHLLEPTPVANENPKYVKAFKVNDVDDALETTIEEIIWNTSSFGVLVPKARVTPIMFGNVEVKHAALHNVEWAEEMGAGVGARVKILRSGEIIPKIVEVVKRKTFKLPDPKVVGEYRKEGKKLVLKSAESPEVRAKKIARMFGVLKLDSLGGGLASRMVESGFDTTARVARMTEEDMAQLPKVKTSAAKYAAEIARIRDGEFTIPQLFLASGVADSGLGESWMEKLSAAMPEVFDSAVRKQDVLSISKVIGPAAASTFAAAWPAFRAWMREVRPQVAAIKKKAAPKKGKLNGQCFSWTGYRSKEEEAFVESLGGQVVSFGSKTTVLFYKTDGKASSKVAKAGSKAKMFNVWKKTI